MTKGLSEEHPPLSAHEAVVEANRCLYCYDAPCTHACPTHIDIPRFIKKISTDNLTGSARAIFDANLLGATCARVCPVEELCEGACVLGKEHRPIHIGRLQRHAMDHAYRKGVLPTIAAPTGKKIAVIGSGPAGLSCAGELARRGHQVTVFEKRELGGGLSTYGIITLREPVAASLAEVEMIKRLGVRVENDRELGTDLNLEDLQKAHDAVFLALGLGATPAMGIPGEEHIVDGLEYIEHSKLSPETLRVGSSVAVIGAGNTAIDCATIARRLGAENVVMVYRRSEREVSAYPHECAFVRQEGVEFRFLAQPVRVTAIDGAVVGLACQPMKLGPLDHSGRATTEPSGDPEFIIPCDQIVKAIGQEKPSLAERLGLAIERGYIRVNPQFETSIGGVFAGGDCVRSKNAASTVMAVQDGKLAAAAIDAQLTAVNHG